MSSICGGVISFSEWKRQIREHGVEAASMAFLMKDEPFKDYVAAKKARDDKKAQEIFNKHAISQI